MIDLLTVEVTLDLQNQSKNQSINFQLETNLVIDLFMGGKSC